VQDREGLTGLTALEGQGRIMSFLPVTAMYTAELTGDGSSEIAGHGPGQILLIALLFHVAGLVSRGITTFAPRDSNEEAASGVPAVIVG
jgi:hypothetical protein